MLNLATSTAPGSPATGDRYILQTGFSGFGSCVLNDIAQYSGASWTCFTPGTATTVFVSQISTNYTFNGSAWVSLGSTVNHNTLVGLQGGNGSNQFYHLNLADYTNLTSANAQLAQLLTTGGPTFQYLTLTGTQSSSVAANFSVGGTATFSSGNLSIRGVNYLFPGSDGAGSGYVLATNGSGTLSWTAPGACAACIVQGGNTLGAPIVLGSDDAQSVIFQTNNINRFTIDSDGNFILGSTTQATAPTFSFVGTGAASFGGSLAVTNLSTFNSGFISIGSSTIVGTSTFTSGVVLPSFVPTLTSNVLYNNNGTLMFNGQTIGSGANQFGTTTTGLYTLNNLAVGTNSTSNIFLVGTGTNSYLTVASSGSTTIGSDLQILGNLLMADNDVTGFNLNEAGNNYMSVTTANGSEGINFGNFTTNPYYAFLGGGQIRAGTGTVVAPTYSFGSDTTTGMFQPANNVLAFSRGGGESMRINANGYVTIGSTTTSSYQLDVQTTYPVPNGMRVTNNSTTNTAATVFHMGNDASQSALTIQVNGSQQIGANANAILISQTNAAPLSFFQNGGEKIRLATNGNIGIGGTATPSFAFLTNIKDSYQTGTATFAGSVVLNSSTPDVTTNALYNTSGNLYWNGGQLFTGLEWGTTSTGKYTLNNVSVGTSVTNNLFTVATGTQVGFNVTTSGNVGIGTSTPQAFLSIAPKTGVNQAASIHLVPNSTNNYADIVFFGTSTALDSSTWQISKRAPNDPQSPNGLMFFQYAGGVPTARLTLDQNGNFGIGTYTPQALLNLQGVGTTSNTNAVLLSAYGVGTTTNNTNATSQLLFAELNGNGSNTVGFKAPDSIGTSTVWTLPNADGTAGQCLQTSGAAALLFGSCGGGTSNPSYTYTEPINAGDLVKINAGGTVSKIVSTLSGVGTSFSTVGSPVIGDTGTVVQEQILALDSTTYVALFRDTTKTNYQVRVGNLSGGTVTWGSAQDTGVSATTYAAILDFKPFNTDRFIIALAGAHNGNTNRVVFMGQISGLTASFGSLRNVNSDTSGTPYQINVTQINASKIMVFFGNANGSGETRLATYAVSGTTLSYDNNYTQVSASGDSCNCYGGSWADIISTDADRAIIAYSVVTSSTAVRYRGVSLSGTTISFSGATDITTVANETTDSIKSIRLAKSNTGVAVLVIGGNNGGTTQNTLAYRFTQSGTTVTNTGNVTLNSNTTTAKYGVSIACSLNNICVVMESTAIASNGLKLYSVDATNTAPLLGTSTVVAATTPNTDTQYASRRLAGTLNVQSGQYVLVYNDSSVSDDLTSRYIRMGNSISVDQANYAGIALTTAGTSSTGVIAILSGQATGLSGLVPGQLYYIDPTTGGLTTSTTAYVAGRALNTTTLQPFTNNFLTTTGAVSTSNALMSSISDGVNSNTYITTNYDGFDEDRIRMFTAGQQRFMIDTSGAVSINNSVAGALFQVTGTSSAVGNSVFKIQDASSNSLINIVDTGVISVGTQSQMFANTQGVAFGTSTVYNALTIGNTGNRVGGIYLEGSSSAPSNMTNALYNIGNTLYFNGMMLGTSNSASTSYIFAKATSVTNPANGSGHYQFQSIESQYGNDISLDLTTAYTTTTNAASRGRFTLKAGKTYKLQSSIVGASSTFVGYGWYNADTNTLIGAPSMAHDYGAGSVGYSSSGPASAVITPTTDTRVEVRCISSGSGACEANSTSYGQSWASVEVIAGYAPTLGQMVDYVFATKSSDQTGVGANIDITWQNYSGSISNGGSATTFSLTAGKTYELTASLKMDSYSNTTTGNISYQWVDSTNTPLPNQKVGSVDPVTNTGANSLQPTATVIYTPSVNTLVKLRVTAANGTASVNNLASFAKITQIGSTAFTGQGINWLSSATGTASIDNLSYQQAWNWSTATSTQAFLLQANALTTGSILQLTSSSNTLTSTSGLLGISYTGTSTSGNFVNFNLGTASPKFVVDTTGEIGVGTSSPSAQFDIRVGTTTANYAAFRITNFGGTATTMFANNNGVAFGTSTVYNALTIGNTPSTVGGIYLEGSSSAPSNIANALYNIGNSLYFNGMLLGTSNSASTSYIQATYSGATNSTNVLANDHFKFNTVNAQFGNDITLDTASSYQSGNNLASVGRFTLKAGKTYKLQAYLSAVTFSSTSANFQWYNTDTGAAIGSVADLVATSHTSNYVSGDGPTTYFTPTVNTRVELRFLNALTSYESDNVSAIIEVIAGYAPTLGQMVDYTYGNITAVTNVAATQDLNFTTSASNMSPTSPNIVLKAGMTYRLEAAVEFDADTAGDQIIVNWVDSNNAILTGAARGNTDSVSTDVKLRNNQPIAAVVYTPSVDTTVKVRVTGVSGTTGDIQAGWLIVQQVGSTAFTGAGINFFSSATGTATIDNLNFQQTWNWSTLGTGTGFLLQANALSTGSLLQLSSSSGNLNSSSGILGISYTGTSTSGNFVNFNLGTASPKFVVGVDGEIGIGTASPSAAFDIRVGTSVADYASFRVTNFGGTSTTMAVYNNAVSFGTSATPNALNIGHTGGVYIESGTEAPANITNALYNLNNSLYFNGYLVGTSNNVAPSYIYNRASAVQVVSANETRLNIDTTDAVFGGDITFNSTNRQWMLKAGKTYKLYVTVPYDTGDHDFQWFDVTANAYMGTLQSKSSNSAVGETSSFFTLYTPTVDSTVELRARTTSTSGTIGFVSGSRNLNPQTIIEVVAGYAPVVGQITDYIYLRKSTNQANIANNTDVTFQTKVAGNMNYSLSPTSYVTLKAGKTYRLEAGFDFAGEDNGTADDVTIEIVDLNNVTLPNQTNANAYTNSSYGTGGTNPEASLQRVSPITTFVYTPTVDTNIKLQTVSVSGGTIDVVAGYLMVTQLGSTYATSFDFGLLSGASTPNSLDNGDKSQTWLWGTATTGTALTLQGNSLTTGGVLQLSSSSNALNSTNGILSVIGTGTSGNLFTIKGGSTGTSPYMTVTASGNVGMGTNAPTANLSIIGNNILASNGARPALLLAGTDTSTNIAGNSQASLLHIVNTSGIVNSYASIGFITTTSGGSNGSDAARISTVFTTPASNYGDLVLMTKGANSSNGVSERMRITSLGNVGVGTATPGGLFSIGSSTPTSNLSLFNISDNITGDMFQVLGSGNVGIGTTTPNAKLGIQGGIGVNNLHLYLAANGNVGIGSSNPSSNLHVLGSATNAMGAVITNNSSSLNAAAMLQLHSESQTGTLLYNNSVTTSFAGPNSLNLINNANAPIGFFTNASTERMRIDTSGNVGIGTTTPAYPLQVVGNILASGAMWSNSVITQANGVANPWRFSACDSSGDANCPPSGVVIHQDSVGTRLAIASNGNVGIGTTSPAQALTITATSGGGGLLLVGTNNPRGIIRADSATNAELNLMTKSSGGLTQFAALYNSASDGSLRLYVNGQDRITVGSATGSASIRFNNYGAGSLVTDGSGNITASSDERLKNITGTYTKGLAEILKLEPINYQWNELSGMDTTGAYSGFSAQNVQSAIPEAVGTDSRGYLTLQDRPLLAALVNAVKEQQKQIVDIQTAIEKAAPKLAGLEVLLGNEETLATHLAKLDERLTAAEGKIKTLEQAIAELAKGQGATSPAVQGVLNTLATTGGVTVLTDVEITGQLYASADIAGSVTLSAGTTTAKVVFSKAYKSVPTVSATLYGKDAHKLNVKYAVTEVSKEGFTIEVDPVQDKDLTFAWIALGKAGVDLSQEGHNEKADPIANPEYQVGPPPAATTTTPVAEQPATELGPTQTESTQESSQATETQTSETQPATETTTSETKTQSELQESKPAESLTEALAE
ncbi:MAG TPA: tail fiber domain-containing protein [Patescibacteria group bacterium]|nr:tail fiber domain-containing protein [Patescibacteria group bacterium]